MSASSKTTRTAYRKTMTKGKPAKASGRRCRVCGCDPWPNRFYCKQHHGLVSSLVDADMLMPR